MDVQKVDLGTINNGAALELFQEEFKKVLANINDISVDAKGAREIKLVFKIAPNEVETIRNLTREGLTVEIGAKKYSVHDLKMVVDNRPLKTLELQTLTGLVSYLDAQIDDMVFTPALCIVHDHENVSVVDEIDEQTRKREVIVRASLPAHGNKFPFGEYIEHEKFIIGLKSMFVESPDQEELILYVSLLSINNTLDVNDDGISQEAVVKRGISGALKDKAMAPTIVLLKPYRTFLEVPQPASNFLFRMKAFEGRVPMCALFEADGGAWKKKAMENIAAYLKKEMTFEVIF